MKPSEQLTLLLQIEDRLTALEKIIYQSDVSSILSRSEKPDESVTRAGTPGKEAAANVLPFEVSPSDIESMSLTELSQICRSRGIAANPCMDREDMTLALQSGESLEDKLLHIRHEIKHFIDKVQPSLKQILRCSKMCVEKCPEIRVVDCWTSNRNKIQEN
tara:strand:- start:504 stop:986 length:483 start_codon:yes stop_codon:yes gene_type:complete